MKKYIFLYLLNVFFYYFSKANVKEKKGCGSCPGPDIEANFLKEKISLNYSLLAGLDKKLVQNLINTNLASVEKKNIKIKNIGALNYGENIFKFVDTDDYLLLYFKDDQKPLGIISKNNLQKDASSNDNIFGFDLLSEQNEDAEITLILNNDKYPYLINVKLHHFLQYTHPYLNNGYLCSENNVNKECILVPLNYKKAHIIPRLYFFDIKNKLLLRRSTLNCKYNKERKNLRTMLNDGRDDKAQKGIIDTELDLIYNIMCLKSRDDNVPSFSRYAVFGRYLVKYYKYDEDITPEEQENIIGTAEKIDGSCKYKLIAISLREFNELLNNSKYSDVINCNFYKNRLESDYLKISEF